MNLTTNKNKTSKMKKNKKLSIFSGLVSLIIIAVSTTMSAIIGSLLTTSSYDVDYTNSVKDKTLSLSFEYQTKSITSSAQLSNSSSETILSGTGWIWKNEGNYYYIATNMHVAAALTFPSYTFQAYDDSSSLKTVSYSELSKASIGFQSDFSSDLITLSLVSTPIVVYTTLNDKEYNNAINEDYSYYYNSQKLTGISDICVLRYDFSKTNISGNNENYIYLFNEWLYNYSLDQTYVFDGYVSLKKKKYFSGGYPAVISPIGIKQLKWTPLSNFSVNDEVTKNYSNGWDVLNNNKSNTTSSPLSFIDTKFISTKYPDLYASQQTSKNFSSKPESTNFINTGYTGYFNAYSDHGASGSLIGTSINGKFAVIGIYWGSSKFNISNKNGTVTKELGAFDLFVSSKYNLVNSINDAINNDYANIQTK